MVIEIVPPEGLNVKYVLTLEDTLWEALGDFTSLTVLKLFNNVTDVRPRAPADFIGGTVSKYPIGQSPRNCQGRCYEKLSYK